MSHIYWNQRLHDYALSEKQIEIANQTPCLSFLHGYLFNTPNDIAIAPAMRNGVYEYFEISYMKGILKEGDVVIDVGACLGLFAVVASNLVGNGKVLAIEPGDIQYLKYNLEINCPINYHIINKAAGAFQSTAFLQIDESNFGNHTVSGISTGLPVDVCAVDEVIGKSDKVKFIKIDTQGDELNVIRGATKTILRNKDIHLLVEVAPSHLVEKGHKYEHLIDMIHDTLGMRLYIISPKYMTTSGSSLQVNFAAGYELLSIQPDDLKGFIQWELDQNPSFFTNIIAKKS